ncbi:MAG: hypothetical protein J5841_09035 [Clostridia bacterium]|nr:hypothetical protein [Clostridia bacterium]
MMKRILCLLAALVLCFVFSAAAEETAEPVTAAELGALMDRVLAEALTTNPLNDPAEESAQSEDGTCFLYENARIYADGTELTADTPVYALAFEGIEGTIIRGTGIDTRLEDLLAAYPQDNYGLAGTREEAVLYLREGAEGGFLYGRLLRDGQRVTAVEYGEVQPVWDQFRCTAVTYSVRSGLVDSIRVEGLNIAQNLMDAASMQEMYDELISLAAKNEYSAAETSRVGTALTPFDEKDLVFDQFSYTAMQPETLPGVQETELLDNEDGTWLLRCDGDGYEAVFLCDENGKNASILSFSILDEDMEGPRHVRIGDEFNEDFSRFRSGENEMSDDMTELLYGTEESASYGTASYDPSEMNLRYVTETADGLRVELLLKYEYNVLTEIIIHTV